MPSGIYLASNSQRKNPEVTFWIFSFPISTIYCFYLFFGRSKHFCEHIHIPGFHISNVLAELDKVDGIFTSDSLSIEGAEA